MKTTKMTAGEARGYVKRNNAKLQTMYDNAPVIDDGFADTDAKPIARGFAAFKEYINRQGRPKAADPKVSISIRIPQSKAVGLRATGPGWQTRVSDYVVKGINCGEFVTVENE